MNLLKKIEDHWFKLSILLSLVCLVIFTGYYYIYSLPKYNQERLNFEKQQYYDKLDAEQQKADQAELANQLNKVNLQTCLSQAEDNYSSGWAAACKKQAATKDSDYQFCFDDYVNRFGKTEEWSRKTCKDLYKIDDSASCILYGNLGTSVTNSFNSQKNECYQRYK